MESYRLESSTAIFYSNNADCTFTVTAPSSRKILVLFRQFELENKDNGNCLDFVNFHDGVDTSAPVLNSEPLCSNSPPDNVTSSGHVLTLHFVTDSRAVYRGFELLFVVYKDSPCDEDFFSCSNNICVSSKSACDGFDHCGDNSDEINCLVDAPQEETSYTGVIVGGVLAFAVLCLIAVFLGVYFYRKRKFMNLLKQFRALPDIPLKEPQPSYPVTDQYIRREFKIKKPPTRPETQNVPRLEIDPMSSTSALSSSSNLTSSLEFK
ncbi:neuropilin and tolloid-like protein 1 isoform X2 [Liolophura sinensis]